jgi:hypothetical protein
MAGWSLLLVSTAITAHHLFGTARDFSRKPARMDWSAAGIECAAGAADLIWGARLGRSPMSSGRARAFHLSLVERWGIFFHLKHWYTCLKIARTWDGGLDSAYQ